MKVPLLKFFSFFLFAVFLQPRCSQSGGTSDLNDASYYLKRDATNTGENILFLDLAHPEDFRFSLSGEGIEASVALDTILPMQDSVLLSVAEVGGYTIKLKIYYQDGTVMLADDLLWRYSTEIPDQANVEFDEEATNDVYVNLVMPVTLDEDINELWVEGDVDADGWHLIDEDGKVAVILTSADGYKDIKVKYRNVFGSEGESQNLRILKKSVKPANCSITVNTRVTASGSVVVYMSADNDGDLYYRIMGDLVGSSNSWAKFTDQKSVTVTIIDNDQPNYLTVNVRDIAENYCPTQKFTITFDETHESMRIAIEDDLLWTDEEDVTALLSLDSIPSDVVEMYIHGNVTDTADTFEWIAYRASVPVELTVVDGNRFVRVKYRINGEETVVKSVAIYLKPFVHVTGAMAPYTVSLSEIVDLASITITGCVEVYNNISPTTSVSCTATGANVTANYLLTDGSTVTRVGAVPP